MKPTATRPPRSRPKRDEQFFVGDPEWIGILEHPDQPHSANNKFLGRYAYLVVPSGKALDVNYIHNDAALSRRSSGNFAYSRDMGVGSWEINLAAFLADLNTNQWDPPAPCISICRCGRRGYANGAPLKTPMRC